MMDPTTSQFTASFPINRLNIDVFILILKAVIDDEAAEFQGPIGMEYVKPVEAVKLSLVCKTWKKIVYNSPSMWPVISLNLLGPSKEVQARLDRLSKKSLKAPVDLYLWYIHSHADGGMDNTHPEEYRTKCSCIDENIVISFVNIGNLHSLQVETTTFAASHMLNRDNLPSTSVLHTLIIYFGEEYREDEWPFDLKNLIIHTPKLVYLSLCNIENVSLGMAEPGMPLLPNLRILKLGVRILGYPVSPNTLVQFISHTPNIENLTVGFTINNEIALPFPTITLFHLRKIVTSTFDPLVDTFSSGKVKTPVLQEFEDIHSNEIFNEECQKFVSLNPTIKKIQIESARLSGSNRFFHSAPNIEELMITGGGEGEWLDCLYSPQSDTSIDRPTMICPSLCKLTILFKHKPLKLSVFEELARVRCVPINEHGLTEVGYKAFELLDLAIFYSLPGYPEMKESAAWRNADIVKVSKNRCRLRWFYRQPTHGLDATPDNISKNQLLASSNTTCK